MITETPYQLGSWICTYTGRQFWPLTPRAEDVDIEDIAHALSQQCRFSGHVRRFYSVAQHCVEVSKRCAPEDALWGLLHDAAEAYLTDLSRPVKHAPEMEPYRDAEDKIQRAVCERFGLDPVTPASVKAADTVELVTEASQLMNATPNDWHLRMGVNPRGGVIIPMGPGGARYAFLQRYEEVAR